MAKTVNSSKTVKKAPPAPVKIAPKATSKAPQASLKAPQKAPMKQMGNAKAAEKGSSQSLSAVIPTLSGQKEDFNPAAVAVKGYRSNPDMENFFRFIYENDLRQEALGILDLILAERQEKRMKKV